MRSVGTLRAAVFVGALISAAGCGGGDGSSLKLDASLGVYEDGSGRVGLAVLAALRDGSGAGPASSWTLTLRGADGELPVVVDYAAPPSRPYVIRLRADVPPRPGTWELVATGDGQTVRATAALEPGAALAPPSPALSEGGDALEWPPVEGAAAYLCRIHERGTLLRESIVTAARCDVSELAAGAYAASVAALSFDPGALAVRHVPERFDASETAIGFARAADAASSVVLRTAGGAYDNGVGPRSFAAWFSLAAADGTATTEDWDLEITGPGLPASSPLQATYWALFPRLVLWSPGVPATPGVYTVTARSATAAVSAPVVIGAPAVLDMPFGVHATSGAQGSARVAWDPVVGARSYLATAYDVETGEVEISLWVAGAAVDFPFGSFVPGRAYEVLVAASDADMAFGAVLPTQISVVENVFDRASFVAR